MADKIRWRDDGVTMKDNKGKLRKVKEISLIGARTGFVIKGVFAEEKQGNKITAPEAEFVIEMRDNRKIKDEIKEKVK